MKNEELCPVTPTKQYIQMLIEFESATEYDQFNNGLVEIRKRAACGTDRAGWKNGRWTQWTNVYVACQTRRYLKQNPDLTHQQKLELKNKAYEVECIYDIKHSNKGIVRRILSSSLDEQLEECGEQPLISVLLPE